MIASEKNQMGSIICRLDDINCITFLQEGLQKKDYVEPMFMIVKDILPEEDYMHWLNVKKLKTMTNEQFERFWKVHQQNFHNLSIW